MNGGSFTAIGGTTMNGIARGAAGLVALVGLAWHGPGQAGAGLSIWA